MPVCVLFYLFVLVLGLLLVMLRELRGSALRDQSWWACQTIWGARDGTRVCTNVSAPKLSFSLNKKIYERN